MWWARLLNVITGLLDAPTPPVTNSYESIQTYTLGSSQSSVTFSSIPSTYKHLQLRLFLRGDYSGANYNDNVLLRFNSDSGSNYTRHLLFVQNGTVVESYGTGGTSSAFAGAAPNASTGISNTFSAGITDILDYANTNKYKTVRTLEGYDTNGGGKQRLCLESGAWLSTSAINSITITSDNADNWVQYSSFALYGIKG